MIERQPGVPTVNFHDKREEKGRDPQREAWCVTLYVKQNPSSNRKRTIRCGWDPRSDICDPTKKVLTKQEIVVVNIDLMVVWTDGMMELKYRLLSIEKTQFNLKFLRILSFFKSLFAHFICTFFIFNEY